MNKKIKELTNQKVTNQVKKFLELGYVFAMGDSSMLYNHRINLEKNGEKISIRSYSESMWNNESVPNHFKEINNVYRTTINITNSHSFIDKEHKNEIVEEFYTYNEKVILNEDIARHIINKKNFQKKMTIHNFSKQKELSNNMKNLLYKISKDNQLNITRKSIINYDIVRYKDSKHITIYYYKKGMKKSKTIDFSNKYHSFKKHIEKSNEILDNIYNECINNFDLLKYNKYNNTYIHRINLETLSNKFINNKLYKILKKDKRVYNVYFGYRELEIEFKYKKED